MTDLLASYGLPLLALVTFAASLALPIPAFLALLSAGALAASGHLAPIPALCAAFLGAALGDQCGYHFGHHIAPALHRTMTRHPHTGRLLARAEHLLSDHGGLGVFLSRWLLAPLGPYINLLSGTAELSWFRFTLWAMTGKALWIGLYCGLGYGFAQSLPRVATVVRQTSTALLFLALIALAALLLHRQQSKRRR
ncbi:DedA family protein [Shimia sp. FJ5]|uniref:DedA family protein n=1 Tax=Shimia sp. FJ5 TaxID=3079054 RepID=UPI002629D0F0|nr:VTT domain-containing protein [Shimia sp. FJ5]MDV4144025.1 VTT domain-containing protein [Shimia sp. FJ5]